MFLISAVEVGWAGEEGGNEGEDHCVWLGT